jgi:hypothetical protein
MRKKTRRIVIGITVFVVILCLMYPILLHRRAYSIIEDVDVNSGDVRTRKYIFLLRVKNEINATRFSHEVHRVGIDVPEDRIWKRIRTEEGLLSKKINYKYADAVADCISAKLALEFGDIPDEKRKVILQEMLENLRAGKLDEIKDQVKTLSNGI